MIGSTQGMGKHIAKVAETDPGLAGPRRIMRVCIILLSTFAGSNSIIGLDCRRVSLCCLVGQYQDIVPAFVSHYISRKRLPYHHKYCRRCRDCMGYCHILDQYIYLQSSFCVLDFRGATNGQMHQHKALLYRHLGAKYHNGSHNLGPSPIQNMEASSRTEGENCFDTDVLEWQLGYGC